MKGQSKSFLNWKLTNFIIFCLIKFSFASNAFHTLGHINETAWFCLIFSLFSSLLQADTIFQGNATSLGSKMQSW